jgi:SAM-dependent methyltransferase
VEKSEYLKHFELEETHWWFRGRRKILLKLIRASMPTRRPLVWLDAGCGTGFNLKALEEFGDIFGCDYSEEALRFSRKRGLRNIVRADVQRLPFQTGRMDRVSFLDVLYHRAISDDVAVLREAHRVLKPEGLLVIADSALEILRGRHDVAVHGRERYRKKTLRARLAAADFEVVRMGYFNFFLFPAILAIRLWERARLRGAAIEALVQSDLKAVWRPLNSLLFAVLSLETLLAKKIDLPVGSSIICLARKKG